MDSLGIMRPDSMPRATQHICNICSFIKILENKGFAYSIDGDVYFSVLKDKNYGKLSNQNITEQNINQQGRITSREKNKKVNPQDFALWKKAKEDEPSFDSPWGKGRPGWHIECSAMVKEELGETIDIHLGGADLIFPHHENEIAQSESANDKKLANYWLHNGMVNVNGEKMSKSLKNFTTIRDLIDSGISPMALRYFVLTVNYRKPLDFTDEGIKSASEAWKTINSALSIFDYLNENDLKNSYKNCDSEFILEKQKSNELKKNKCIEYLNNDLNTAASLAIIYELAKPIKNFINQYQRNQTEKLSFEKKSLLWENWKTLFVLSEILGLKKEKQSKKISLGEAEILTLINKRLKAKQNRNYEEADSIRNMLKEEGIELIDQSPETTKWIRF